MEDTDRSVLPAGDALRLIRCMEELLSRQAEAYKALVSLADAQRECLVNSDLEQLERIVRTQESLVVLLGRLEDERLQVHSSLAILLEFDPADTSIDILCDAVGRPQSRRLEETAGEIKRSLEDLAQTNRLNATLIKDALSYMQHWMDIISCHGRQPETYGSDAKGGPGRPRMIDRLV